MAWFWLVPYYLGALATLRRLLPFAQRNLTKWCGEWCSFSIVPFAMILVVWPLVAFVWASWKLAFMEVKGIKTRRIERATRARALAEQQRHEWEKQTRRAEAIVKEFAIGRSLEPGDTVLDYQVAAARFNEDCEQVYRDRGKPWRVGVNGDEVFAYGDLTDFPGFSFPLTKS